MSFETAWNDANPDAAGNSENDLDPPADGLYDVTLIDASAFTSKAGDAFVKTQFEVLTGPSAGHQWTVLHGFKSPAQGNVTKKAVRDLGVDVDAVKSQEEIDSELRAKIGQYFAVEVKTNGKFRNTYIAGTLAGVTSDVPAPPPEPVTAGAPSNDDGVPF